MNTIVYHATKGGLIAFTRDLAWKWARHGITVNAIAPGWFPTDMSRYVLDRQHEFVRSIPLGRFGGPDDLKGAVATSPRPRRRTSPGRCSSSTAARRR